MSHRLHRAARHEHQRALLLDPFEEDVHRAQLQRGGILLIDVRRLLEQRRDLHLGLAEDDARPLLARGLRLARHGVLQLGRG